MDGPLASELVRRARLLARVLESRGTHYAFIGELAMDAWTIPVPTYDLELCLAIGPEAAPDLVRALGSEGFLPPPTTWIESIGTARFQEFTVHFPYGAGLRAVDVYLATDPFQQEALSRRRRVELEAGFFTYVATAEDLLIYRMIAWRPKDRSGIERLLAVQRDIEWIYLRKWASRFRLDERLGEILRDAGFAS